MPNYYEASTNRTFFVGQGLAWSEGKPWFTLYSNSNKDNTTSGSHRLKSPALPYRDTKEEAQADLDNYAKTHGFEAVKEEAGAPAPAQEEPAKQWPPNCKDCDIETCDGCPNIPVELQSDPASTAQSPIGKLPDQKCPYLAAWEGHSGDARHLPRLVISCNGECITYYNDEGYAKAKQYCLDDFQACEKYRELSAEQPQETTPCRVCGCTDDHACEGGCYWVEDDLCSRCAETIEQEEREEAGEAEAEQAPDADAAPAAPEPPAAQPEKKPRKKREKPAPAAEKPAAQETPVQETTGDPLTDAVAKLRAEMGDGNHSYTRVIGDFLLQRLEAHPDDATKILAKDKTIAGSLNAMQSEAQKHRSGSCAVLTDEEGFAVVLRYFGIDGAAPPRPAAPAAAPAAPPPPASPAKPAVSFDVSLDDLL